MFLLLKDKSAQFDNCLFCKREYGMVTGPGGVMSEKDFELKRC